MVPALLCVAVGSFSVAVYAPRFTLSWEHSIESVEWRETWRVHTKTMRLVEARIKGAGAGIKPPKDAVLKDGWFVYVPKATPQTRLVMPDRADAKPVRLCLPGDTCRPIRVFLPREAPKDAPVILTLEKENGCRPEEGGTPR
ncbi:MAG: DUF1850 domain-containing protein [Rhodospirillaceae bacterium]